MVFEPRLIVNAPSSCLIWDSVYSTAEVLACAEDFFPEAAKDGFALAKKIVARNATVTTSAAGKSY